MATRYRYFATYASVTREVFPIEADKINYRWEKEPNCVFKRRMLKNDLVFVNDRTNGIDDYDYFYAIEITDQCGEIEFTIEEQCSNTWTTAWTGRFSTGMGKFDTNKCRFTIRPEVKDKYTCMLDYIKAGTEYNILDHKRYRATSVFGTVQTLRHSLTEEYYGGAWHTDTESCRFHDGTTWDNAYPCPPNYDEWCEFSYDFAEYERQGENDYRVQVWVYKREVYTTTCSSMGACVDPPGGTGWQVLEDNCMSDNECVYWRCSDGDYSFDNLVRMDEVIQGALNAAGCDLTLSSIFFNYNPDVLDPVYVNLTAGGTENYVTEAATKVNHLFLSQKTDIKYPSSDNAWKGIWSLQKILDDLRKMFEVYWDITDDGDFILEHWSYFPRNVSTLDLTALSAKYKYFKKLESYEHMSNETPEMERFHWMDELDADGSTLGDLFRGVPIIYDPLCSTKGKFEDVSVDDITTDLNLIATRTDDIADDGFVMLHCFEDGGNYYIDSDGGRINGHLSWTLLHQNYLRWNRYRKTGNMNGVADTDFFLCKPNVRQVKMSFPLCCGDVFDPQNAFTTILGDDILAEPAYIMDAEYNLRSEILTVTFGYSY